MRRQCATVPVATPAEWACAARVANGPNIFQMLLVRFIVHFCRISD